MKPLRAIAEGMREFFIPRGPSIDDGPLRVTNVTRGSVLATHLDVAASGPKRRKGLLGREGLSPGEGLWIIPCESVHTFFMRFPIDLVYLDRENRIKKVRNRVGAWRLSVCFSAHSILELPAGTVRGTETRRGDIVEFTPADSNRSNSQ